MDMSADRRLLCAKELIERVQGGEISPWFNAPIVTKGLVLWYIGPFLPLNEPAVQKIAEELIQGAQRINMKDHLNRACIVLGLLASKRLIKTKSDIISTIELLINQIIASQESGKWTGESVGVFGFEGMLYSDDHFSTVLSLLALMEYSSS
jgi:hypothetical protein